MIVRFPRHTIRFELSRDFPHGSVCSQTFRIELQFSRRKYGRSNSLTISGIAALWNPNHDFDSLFARLAHSVSSRTAGLATHRSITRRTERTPNTPGTCKVRIVAFSVVRAKHIKEGPEVGSSANYSRIGPTFLESLCFQIRLV